MLIYCIKNEDGKIVYVGQTTQKLENRILKHKSNTKNGDTILYRALRKYGFENFTFEILEDNIDTLENLDLLEQHYIKLHETFPCGHNAYNMTSGGENIFKVLSDELKEKYRISQLKRYSTIKSRVDHGILMKKVHKDNPEIRSKQSNSQKNRYKNEDERLKTSTAMLKLYETNPEIKDKLKIATTKRYIDNPELRVIQSELSKNDERYINGRKKAHEIRRKKVFCLELNLEFESLKECADHFGVKYPSIIKAIKKGKKCKGHTFSYERGETNMTTNVLEQLKEAGYDACVAIATVAEIEAKAACGQLAICIDQTEE